MIEVEVQRSLEEKSQLLKSEFAFTMEEEDGHF
jgi:hypothetical protein